MPKLKNINSTDLRGAIVLGCRTMQRVFNADDNDIPFFKSQLVPQASLKFNHWHSESHVPGRHLNALLTAEAVTGIELDEEAVQKHARAAFFSFSGKLALPLNRDRRDGPLVNFLPHNLREGMHALYALARYRDCPQARETAQDMIGAVFEHWRPDRRWDPRAFDRRGLVLVGNDNFIFGEARLIGPLVKYYRATGYGPALDLALVLSDKAIGEFFLENGEYDPNIFGSHVHSATCVMSSLAQLADLTRDASLMQRVRAFYDNGLWGVRDELGWSIESSICPDEATDQGESNNTGDILETALILGRWGYPQYFHDAERILRGHLLPSQLRDTSFVVDPPNPEGADGKRHLADRHLGAFGVPASYGHRPIGIERVVFNMDIVGGVVGSLCEAVREAVRFDEAGHRVNLLFDLDTPTIQLDSPYTHGQLRVRLKRPGAAFVRIPPWADRQAMSISPTEAPLRFTRDYLFLASPQVDQPITIGFERPLQELVLKHRRRAIRVRMRGDEVLAMDNFGADLTFFNPYDG